MISLVSRKEERIEATARQVKEPDARPITLVIERQAEPQYVICEKEDEVSLTDDEKILLAKMVHAEAEDQDAIGKRLVVDCALNRMDSETFPNCVHGVLLMEGQFCISGTYSDDDMAAVEAECKERLDHEIVFFRTKHFHNFGQACYQHGDHFFNKE